MNLTIVVECNKKPLFAEEPRNAELRRIIDFPFRSTFTTDTSLINKEKHIYLANLIYKTKEFQNKHKYALLKILFNQHKKYYKENNSILTLPRSISDRTKAYLESSCDIVQWFKDNYVETQDKKVICKIKDIYDIYVTSEYFFNLPKADKRKQTKSYFGEYVENNIFFRNYYKDRCNNIRNVLCGWEKIHDDLSEDK